MYKYPCPTFERKKKRGEKIRRKRRRLFQRKDDAGNVITHESFMTSLSSLRLFIPTFYPSLSVLWLTNCWQTDRQSLCLQTCFPQIKFAPSGRNRTKTARVNKEDQDIYIIYIIHKTKKFSFSVYIKPTVHILSLHFFWHIIIESNKL